jgi:hypothetical protein
MPMQTPPTPPPDPEEQARAERAQWILYGVMGLFILAPFIGWLIFGR